MSQSSSNPTVNLNKINGTAVSTNSGTVDAGTQRVILASNQTAIPVTDNGGSLTVDGTVSINSIPAGTNNIGDVDVVSLPSLPAGTNTIGNVKITDGTNNATIKAASTAPVATDPALVVAISPNSSLPVSDGGGSLTVDGSVSVSNFPATQPVSGTITANIGTSGNLALDATLTGGTQKSIARGGAKGTTVAADVTSTAVDANTQALDVSIKNASIPVTGTFWQTTQPVSGTVTANQGGTWTVGLSAGTNAIGSITNTSFAVTQATAANLQTTATQALGSAATRWYTQISDGTNSPAIKAASTAAAATDPALVVAISPNNTIPVSLASVPSHAVTNAGTFAVQAAQSGTWNINSLTSITNTVTTQGRSLTNATTTAYATNLVVKATAGTLYVVTGFNSKTTGQFIQIHDATALPADASVPKIIFYVAGNSNFSFDLGEYGRAFANGIVICNSSTGPTKTIGAADCWFDVQYV